jgi:hypothetical protein
VLARDRLTSVCKLCANDAIQAFENEATQLMCLYEELRYKNIVRNNPEGAAAMLVQAQAAVNEKNRIYEDLAARDGSRFLPHWEDV